MNYVQQKLYQLFSNLLSAIDHLSFDMGERPQFHY